MTGREVCVFFRRENSQDIVVFMYGLVPVSSLLLVEVVAVWVSKGSLDSRGILVAAIL